MAGPQCCTPSPYTEYRWVGQEETCGPFLAYTTSHRTPTAAVVLVHDAYGFSAPLLRKLADKIASAGYFVVVPDFFHNDPYVPADPQNPLVGAREWIKNHQALDSVEGAKKLLQCLHEKGFSSVGAVGFCWGGKVAVELAKGDCLKAAILAHPSFVTLEDIQDVKIPIAILAAEIDRTTPPALVQKFIDALKSKPEVESFAHVYEGVEHGWACRYNPDNSKEVANAEEAHNKMLEWFGKFVH